MDDGGADASAGGGGGGGGGGGMAGWTIPDASPELPPPIICGDLKIQGGETCEDGNTTAGDGCSAACHLEPNYLCPDIGKPCKRIVICGDHVIDGAEACDDGNKASGDGCTMDCKLECGWECPPNALCRAAKCGDGMMAGHEQCDDANATAGDGCSPTCQLEGRPAAEPEGWACTTPKVAATGCAGPTTCAKTTCGNKIKEGSEQCDDGNQSTGDGCTPFCRLEPICPPAGGACATACGDGLLLPIDKQSGQECDDGDTIDGDGCSAKCKVEAGFKCKDVTTKPDTLVLPIVYRDFKGWNEAGGHVDFQNFQGNGRGFAGIAQATLGPAGVPVHVAGCWPTPGMGYPALLTANGCPSGNPPWDPAVDWFGMWYVDNATYNKTIVATLTLTPIAGGAFQYASTAFFPIDGAGFGNTPGQGHNFGFTSVVRTWFEYTGPASLAFYGDDDVWVYVNKKLAVDLGGTHQQSSGSVTLDAANGHGYVCDFVAPGNAYPSPPCDATLANGHDVDLGLKVASVYEIAVFQAERFATGSNYQLTMSGFTGNKSSCASECGDGTVTPPETCDLGPGMNVGAYGGCNADCTLAPYCGDKIVQRPPEQCDTNGNCDKNCKLIVPP